VGSLAPRPTPKLENYPLSAVRDCLSIAGTFHIRKPSPPSAIREYILKSISSMKFHQNPVNGSGIGTSVEK